MLSAMWGSIFLYMLIDEIPIIDATNPIVIIASGSTIHGIGSVYITAAMAMLATTEPHKVPETIRSRTQRYDFHRVSVS